MLRLVFRTDLGNLNFWTGGNLPKKTGVNAFAGLKLTHGNNQITIYIPAAKYTRLSLFYPLNSAK